MITPENQKRIILGSSLIAFTISAIALNYFVRKFDEETVREIQSRGTQIAELSQGVETIGNDVDMLATRVSRNETSVPKYHSSESITIFTNTPMPAETPNITAHP